ncbi:MAG: hypothetical protein JWR07_1878 [Nevskia sp.]|nr:hypothetical protein [Nevskia sp.]
MSDGEFLKPAELYDLTGFARAAEQEAWLKAHCVLHRRDGKRVIVCRIHARAWVEGREVVASEGPNWSALNA